MLSQQSSALRRRITNYQAVYHRPPVVTTSGGGQGVVVPSKGLGRRLVNVRPVQELPALMKGERAMSEKRVPPSPDIESITIKDGRQAELFVCAGVEACWFGNKSTY